MEEVKGNSLISNKEENVKSESKVIEISEEKAELEDSGEESKSARTINELKLIFEDFSELRELNAVRKININQIHKMLKQCKLHYTPSILQRINLVFKPVQKNITFEVFLNCLPKISKIFFPSKVNSIQILIDTLNKEYKILFQQKKASHNEEINSGIIKIILQILDTLKGIYVLSFPWELKGVEKPDLLMKRSVDKMVKFLLQFDLSPSMISPGMANRICNNVTCQNESLSLSFLPFQMGKVFTFSKFIDILYLICVEKLIEKKSEDIITNFILMLQRMQISQGYIEYQSQKSVMTNTKLSLLPSKELIESLLSKNISPLKLEGEEKGENNYKNQDFLPLNDSSKIYLSPTPASNNAEGIEEDNEKELKEILKDHLEILNLIFESYSALGSHNESCFLNSYQFTKLIQNAFFPSTKDQINSSSISNLSNKEKYPSKFTNAEINLIFTQICSSKYSSGKSNPKEINDGVNINLEKIKKMNFSKFLIALKLISNKIYGSNKNDFVLMIKEKIFPLYKDLNLNKEITDEQLEKLILILKNESVVNMLSLIKKSISPYFKAYSSGNLMNFGQFFKFCCEFSIHPDIMNKQILKLMFNTCSKIYMNTQIENKSLELVIDELVFVELLALCAIQSNYFCKIESSEIKIITMLEKMTLSWGNNALHKRLENERLNKGFYPDILSQIRLKYESHFSQENTLQINNNEFIEALSAANENSGNK